MKIGFLYSILVEQAPRNNWSASYIISKSITMQNRNIQAAGSISKLQTY